MPRAASDDRQWSAEANDQRVGEKLIAIFCLGLVLFSPIVMGIFDRGAATRVAGMPLLYVYLFASWAALVAMLAWVVETAARSPHSATRGVGARCEQGSSRDRAAR